MQDLGPCYQAAVAEEDMEKRLNLCRVFTDLGETVLMKIVSSPPLQSAHPGHCAHVLPAPGLRERAVRVDREVLGATLNYLLRVNFGHNVTSVTSHNISVSSRASAGQRGCCCRDQYLRQVQEPHGGALPGDGQGRGGGDIVNIDIITLLL